MFTRLLYWLGVSAAKPLFDEDEEVISLPFLGAGASHALVWRNWTMELARRGVPPAERVNHHLLMFEDDAVVTPDTIAGLERLIPQLDPCFDLLALDSVDSFCAPWPLFEPVFRMLGLRNPARPPKIVRARTSYSRNTGVLLSYKGAMRLVASLPISRESDLWERDLVTDQLLNVYVSCPRVVRTSGIESVSR